MAEENGDNTIQPEVVEFDSDDMSQNFDTLAKEATENSADQGKMVSDNGNEEESRDLEKNSDIPEGTTEKTSETDFADDHVRKSATVVIVGPNHKFPVRARYLSASVGSCHDLCKYGHKHEPEKKIKRPHLGTIRETQALKRTISDDLATAVFNKEAKKKAFIRRLSLPGPPIAEKDPPTNINMNRSEKDTSRSKLKRIQSETKLSSVTDCGHSSSRSKTDTQAGKKMVVQTQSSSLLENTSQRVKEIKTRKEVEKAKEPMTNSKSPKTPLKKSPRIKARLYKNLRSFSHSKNQHISQEAKINRSGDVPEKKLYMIETNTDKEPGKKASKVAPPDKGSPKTPWGSHFRRNNGSKGCQKGTRISHSSSSFSPSSPVSTASTKQEPSQTKGDNGSKPNTPRADNRSKPNTPRAENGSKPNTPRAKSSVDSKMNAKRRGISHQEEKDDSSWKVKFKRGTVVSLQVANSAPKKLRFKRGRVLVDDQNAKDETPRSLKNKEDTGNEPNDDTKPDTGKVRLRHQEASGKKDNVDLNNVIEETASKLAKTRKSKVKALVGAFETVMSLHDRKPLVEAGAS